MNSFTEEEEEDEHGEKKAGGFLDRFSVPTWPTCASALSQQTATPSPERNNNEMSTNRGSPT